VQDDLAGTLVFIFGLFFLELYLQVDALAVIPGNKAVQATQLFLDVFLELIIDIQMNAADFEFLDHRTPP
jgi:hypothetical protein